MMPRPLARARRPAFRHQRGSRGPLASHAEARQEAEKRQLLPALDEAGEARADGVDQDRQHHGALAAQVIGHHARRHSADADAEQHGGDDDSGIARELRNLLRRQQLAQRRGHHQKQRIVFVAVENPAQETGQQHAPVLGVQLPMPGHARGNGDCCRMVWHLLLRRSYCKTDFAVS